MSVPSPTSSPVVRYFGARRPGKEAAIEDQVAASLTALLAGPRDNIWAAASMAIGAGKPDLTVALFEGELPQIPRAPDHADEILGYLRVAHRARPDTIAARLGVRGDVIDASIEALFDLESIDRVSRAISLTERWRHLFNELVTVEVKVSNRARVLQQAIRNTVFATRSYIAMPARAAERAASDPEAVRWGLGVIAVDDDGDSWIEKAARRNAPRLWNYYYRFALATMQEQ